MFRSISTQADWSRILKKCFTRSLTLHESFLNFSVLYIFIEGPLLLRSLTSEQKGFSSPGGNFLLEEEISSLLFPCPTSSFLYSYQLEQPGDVLSLHRTFLQTFPFPSTLLLFVVQMHLSNSTQLLFVEKFVQDLRWWVQLQKI